MAPIPPVCRPALGCAVLVATLLPAAPQAQEVETFDVSGSVQFATDYVSRGQSFTGGKPFILGSLDLAHASGAYGGIYGANVDFGDGESNSEFGFNAGWAGEAAGFALGANAYYYVYPGVPEDFEYDYLEFGATVGRSFGPFTPALRVNWSPDYFGGRGDEFYVRGTVAYDAPVLDGLGFSVWAGHQFGDAAVAEFVDWGASVAYILPEVATVRLVWTDVDLSGVGDRLTLSLGRAF